MKDRYPFKFLDSYQKDDKDFFFGRKDEIDSLYKMIFETKILLIFGTSGTGKTSLIQCGFANKFEAYDWLPLYIRRGANLIASIDKALCDYSEGRFIYEAKDDHETVIDNLKEKIGAVYNASQRPIYLIFDQFEELYVKGLGSIEEQKYFIRTVQEVLSIEQPVKIIISIREEYLGYLFEFEKEVPQLLQKKLRVEPMTLGKLTEVIKGLKHYHDNFDSIVDIEYDEIDEISEGIFNRLKGKNKEARTIQLPYLQVFLDKLYQNILKNNPPGPEEKITIAELKKMGTFEDVLQDFLEEQVKVISSDLSTKKNKVTPENIWSLLSEFCSLEGTKEPISVKQLYETSNTHLSKNLIDKSLDAFQKSRIVKKSDEKDLYELYHDTLALKIDEKRSEDDISKLEVKRIIKSKAVLNEVFNEKQLNFIRPYEKKLASKLTPEEKALIKKSKKAVRITKLKKRALIIFCISVITGLVAYLGIIGNLELEQNKMSQDILKIEKIIITAQLKIDQALIQENNDPTLSLQLSRQAIKTLQSLDSSAIMDSLINKNYGLFSQLLFKNKKKKFVNEGYQAIDIKEDSLKAVIKAYVDTIITKNYALYKIGKPANGPYKVHDSSFVNFIFPDLKNDTVFRKNDTVFRKNDTVFRLWKGSQETRDAIKNHGELLQVVFPRESAENLQEAMALYKNGTARYWGTNKAYRELKTEKHDKITSIAPIQYDVIGYKMLAAMNNKRIVEWNLNGTKRFNYHNEKKTEQVTYNIKRRDVKLNETIVSIAITSDRQKMFTASDKGIGTIWEANTSTIDLSTDPKNAFNLYQETVLCSAFSNDGSMIATGSKDHKVKIWNAVSGDLIQEFKGHRGAVTSVAFSANDIILYTAALDGSIKKWSLASIDPITRKAIMPWNKNMPFDSLFSEKIIDSIPYLPKKVKTENSSSPKEK